VRFGVETPDAKLGRQWSDILTSEPASDLLVVRKDGALDYLDDFHDLPGPPPSAFYRVRWTP
jgi:hypothetical protein